MKNISLIASIVTVVVVLGGCSSSSKPESSAPSAPAKPAAMGNGGFYAEESFKGRLYVFGTEKAHDSFKQSQQVPHIAKSYIGAGPEGQTVVLEADAKANDLQERLKAEYETRHSAKLP
jgi:hypothetical protein